MKRSRSTQITAAIVAAPADRRHRLLEALAEQLAVGQLGQRIVQGQILRAPLGLDLGRDVGRGAAIAAVAALVVAHRLAGDPERPRAAAVVLAQAEQVAERAALREVVLMALPALDAFGRMQQVAERLAEHQIRRDAGRRGETLRQIAQPQLGIGLPDPVRAGVGDVAEAQSRWPRWSRWHGARGAGR